MDSSALALDTFYLRCLSDHSVRIKLKGYTDTLGSLDFNERLAAKRIATVMSNLNAKGFPKKQVSIEQMGEVATAAGEEWQNRRVQIVIEDAPDMYEQMLGEDYRTQYIKFRNTQDTILVGAEGTSLILPKMAFVNPEGAAVKNVTIELKEYYKLEDLALSNLSTVTTNGQLMETNGTFYVRAFDENGNPCKLAKGKSIDVKIPNVRDASKMKLYKGKKEGSTIKWKRKSERDPLKYGVIRANYSYVQKRKRYTSERAMALLEAHLKKNLEFPENALNNNRCGRVKVEFYIDSDGNLESPSIRGRGLPGAINKHVLKTFREAPKLHASYFSDKRALSFKYSITLKFLTERCFRKFNRSKREVLSWSWQSLQPAAYWNTLRDSITVQNASSLLYRTAGLGWHNCDRLISLQRETKVFEFKRKHEANVNFKILMPQERVVVNGVFSRGEWGFSNVLVDGKAWLLGMKYTDGQSFISKTPIDLTKDVFTHEPFVAMSPEKMKKEIRKLQRSQ